MTIDADLRVAFARFEERLAGMDRTVATFAPTARQVAEMGADVEGLGERFEDLRREVREQIATQDRRQAHERRELEQRMDTAVGRVETACGELGKRLDMFAQSRIGARGAMTLGLLGGAFTLTGVILSHVLG